jgi:CobQ-like glutamine amidotransferase family enzyme
MTKEIHIVHLYPNEMNTYGDRGNIITLTRRLEWRGYEPVIHYHHPGKPFPRQAHIIFGGGGQDSAQSDIQRDILEIGGKLHELAAENVPMLAICGTYQLLGHRFVTHTKEEIKGIGLFDLETFGTSQRLIGNIKVQSGEFGILYGFENHSGQTYLSDMQAPLGKVLRGNGNNNTKTSEGARTINVIGTYMHGPVLPANPQLADNLISIATRNTYGEDILSPIDDHLTELTRAAAKDRAY